MKNQLSALLLIVALPAMADSLPLPKDTPASYRSECGSCHLPFHPALLAASDWQQTLNQLDKHFGSDAAVDRKTRQEISQFLERYAGDPARLGPAGNPPRLTQTSRFIRKHREIPAKTWSDPRIKSAANCEACHRNAASGRFSEHEISIPGLGK